MPKQVPLDLDYDRMTDEQAAKYLGVKRQTLALWRCTGRYGLRFTRVGRAIRYSKSDLDEWLAERSGTSTTQLAGW